MPPIDRSSLGPEFPGRPVGSHVVTKLWATPWYPDNMPLLTSASSCWEDRAPYYTRLTTVPVQECPYVPSDGSPRPMLATHPGFEATAPLMMAGIACRRSTGVVGLASAVGGARHSSSATATADGVKTKRRFTGILAEIGIDRTVRAHCSVTVRYPATL